MTDANLRNSRRAAPPDPRILLVLEALCRAAGALAGRLGDPEAVASCEEARARLDALTRGA